MSNSWHLYKSQPSFVLGFHGTESSTVNALLSDPSKHLKQSTGKLEWLGHGIYFWENDPLRAYEWAADGNPKSKIKEPDAIGAILDLKLCLDLTTRSGLTEVAEAYSLMAKSYKELGIQLPVNAGGSDKLKRELDCQVIMAVHKYREDNGLPAYDSIRAPFREDTELYPGAGFHRRTHVQVAVRNLDCIKGYFRPIPG